MNQRNEDVLCRINLRRLNPGSESLTGLTSISSDLFPPLRCSTEGFCFTARKSRSMSLIGFHFMESLNIDLRTTYCKMPWNESAIHLVLSGRGRWRVELPSSCYTQTHTDGLDDQKNPSLLQFWPGLNPHRASRAECTFFRALKGKCFVWTFPIKTSQRSSAEAWWCFTSLITVSIATRSKN